MAKKPPPGRYRTESHHRAPFKWTKRDGAAVCSKCRRPIRQGEWASWASPGRGTPVFRHTYSCGGDA